jgi:outer membrane protein
MDYGLKTLCGRALLVVAALVGHDAAQAQSAGTWMAKIGVNNINPDVKSGNLSAPSLPNTQIDIKDATSLIVTATYMATDNLSVELYAGLPYKHDVVGAGAIAAVGKIGSVKQVSPTVFGQYRFLAPESVFRPYVGVGLTYAYFYGEDGSGTLTALTNAGGPPTRLSASSAWGVSPQVGATVRINDRWYLDGAVIKTFIKNSASLSTGQQIDVTLDPLSVNLSLGYRF